MFLAFSVFACQGKKSLNEVPVARVGDYYLYSSELAGLFTPGMSQKDSADLRKKYIEKWVKKQLVLQKAELNLNAEQKDVSKELEDYRASLLIYKYEEMLLQQQMDTVIGKNEIQDYYEKNTANFVLNQPAIRGTYIKLQSSSPYQDKVKRWYRSENESDIKDLENYCFQYARKYDYFNGNWTYFEPVSNHLPIKTKDIEGFLKNNRYFEAQDSAYNYYLDVKEYRLSGAVAPMNLVQDDIRRIILNQRKMKFLKNLENDIYSNAYNRDKFEIYP